VGNPEKTEGKDCIDLPFAVLLSQDCDLEADFKCREQTIGNQDKYLLSLLVCPAFNIGEFANGTHFANWQMEPQSSKLIEKIQKNDTHKRFHFLSKNTEFFVPDLVLDFKHFFTLPRDYLYSQEKDVYVASLSELFREELSQRFSNYLSRIGLPELND
tara:strand:+ start:26 stop:499 length:474 start_codon:yes stop_codon:yes gene_type:complete